GVHRRKVHVPFVASTVMTAVMDEDALLDGGNPDAVDLHVPLAVAWRLEIPHPKVGSRMGLKAPLDPGAGCARHHVPAVTSLDLKPLVLFDHLARGVP